MTLYNVGDRVVVREDLEEGKRYKMKDGTKDGVSSSMISFGGEVVTIFRNNNIFNEYDIIEDNGRHSWVDEMFEGKIVKKDNYEIGDKVLIRSDLEVGKSYGLRDLSFAQGMKKQLGKLVTIRKIDRDGDYNIEEDNYYFYNDEMIVGALVKEDELIKQITQSVEEVKTVEETIKTEPIDHFDDLLKGDKVLIRSDLEIGKSYGDVEVEEEMLQFQGKVATIKGSYQDGDFDLDIDDDEYLWSVEMFVGKVEEEVEEVKELGMKYKVGDKVVVRKDLENKFYTNEDGRPYAKDFVSGNMTDFKGKTVTIKEILLGNEYKLEEVRYYWTDGMFEGLVEPKVEEVQVVNQICHFGLHVERVIYNEPATILFYKVPEFALYGGKVLNMSETKKIVSKCNTDIGDKYDKETGFAVALLKAFRKETDKALSKI